MSLDHMETAGPSDYRRLVGEVLRPELHECASSKHSKGLGRYPAMNEYTYVGLDVHQDSITAAILQPGSERAEVVRLSGDLMKVRRLFRRLSKNVLTLPPITREVVTVPLSEDAIAQCDALLQWA